MSRGKLTQAVNAQISDEAAHWFVEIHAGEMDVEKRCEFDAWLRRSPQHVRAYVEMLPLWEEAALVDSQHELSAAALIAGVHEDDVVVPLESPVRATLHVGARREHRALWTLALCATVIAAAIVGICYVDQRSTYSTDVGEQRVVALQDGSSIELNALSRVRVAFDEQQREVELIEGQALFRVEKDARRPFIVTSGATRVRAVGTQFDVYRKRSGTTVTVLEGRVAVINEDTSARKTGRTQTPVMVSAGEQVTATASTVAREVVPNTAAATAWRERLLVFSATPLTEVAEEFNRYNERQLVVRDAQLQ
ncbi:MAG: FecR domain-containing protein, partial [Steroidobacteraceae bacterium]